MVRTVDERPVRALRHVSAWAQAIGLVYVIGFAMVLLGGAAALMVRGIIEAVSWIAGLI